MNFVGGLPTFVTSNTGNCNRIYLYLRSFTRFLGLSDIAFFMLRMTKAAP